MTTLKVRIALAVNPETMEWNSSGWGGGDREPSDKEKMDMAIEVLPEGERRFFIDAEIDVKPTSVIAGIAETA